MNKHQFACALLAATILATPYSQSQEAGWPTYGGNPGGQRFSPANQINQGNVAHLRLAWDFVAQTSKAPKDIQDRASLETTPVLRDGVLFASSAYDDVYAINAENGQQLWHFDPALKFTTSELIVTSRGVALWPLNSDAIDRSHPCATRVFIGTLDARLLAIDAATGVRCEGFGSHGQIDLTQGLDSMDVPGYSVTSPPTVIGNVVVVGSRVGDNERATAEDGVVRAFDVITGRQLWKWEPIAWRGNTHPHVGAANVWSIISADPVLGLIYLPTSAPSLDYYGVARPGDNRDANSVVALDAVTGRRVWGFQTVHHDLWDYDIPSEPLLFTFHDGTPAIAITTKTGQVFVLDRRTGVPLIPIEERPVPQSTVPNEQTSPTQPFSALPMLNDLSLGEPDLSGNGYTRSEKNIQLCRQQFDTLKRDGIYTPISVQGSLQFPGNLGGVNWGGAAFDPTTQTLYANVNRQPVSVRFVPRYSREALSRDLREQILDWPMGLYVAFVIVLCSAVKQGRRRKRNAVTQLPWWRTYLPSTPAAIIAAASTLLFAGLSFLPVAGSDPHFGYEYSDQIGSPYYLERTPIYDGNNKLCASPPWGALVALNLNTRTLTFRSPLGTLVPGARTGTLTIGGPIATAGGLVFTAGGSDKQLHALTADTGQELWSFILPAAGRATPMTYMLHGKQYVVIAAGGHGGLNEDIGGHIVAFALP